MVQWIKDILRWAPAILAVAKFAWQMYITKKKMEAVKDAKSEWQERAIEAERQRGLDAARTEPIGTRRARILRDAVAAEIADRKRRADAK